MYVKSLIGAFLCSFVHHSKSGKGFSLIFSQFYHSWLPQIWGTVVFVGYLTVGFVLDSTTYISPGRIIYMLHSSVVLEKVFLSKLPLLNCPKSGKFMKIRENSKKFKRFSESFDDFYQIF